MKGFMIKFYSAFLTFLMFVVGVFVCALPFEVQAITDAECQAKGSFQAISGVCVPMSSAIGLSDAGGSDTPVAVVITNFMQWLLGVFGFLAIIAFVISGILYLTSAGNEDQAEKAKRGVIWSTVGVIVALSSLIIVNAIDVWLKGNAKF